MNCRNDGLARQASSSQNRPLTATSMMVSGVSLLVARCRTCVTPSTARSTAARWSIEPVMTSRRGPGSSTRLWHSALTVNPARRSSPDASSRPMNACPALPVAPVTRIRCTAATSQIMRVGRRSVLWTPGSVHPLGLHLGSRVDAHESGRARPAVGEAVRGAGRADDDVAGAALEALVADPDQDVSLQDDEGLVVGVAMQVGPVAGLVVHEEERHRARAVLAAFEGAGDVVARQVTGVHVVHRSRCLPGSGCWLPARRHLPPYGLSVPVCCCGPACSYGTTSRVMLYQPVETSGGISPSRPPAALSRRRTSGARG